MKAHERRARIVGEALRVFAESGYEQANMSAIARAADVTTSVLYHYFASKQTLYLAVLEDQAARLSDYAAERIAASPSPQARIIAGADAYLAFAEEHPETWALLLNDSAAADPEINAGRLRAYETIVQRGLAAFAEDIARAGLDPADPRTQLGIEFLQGGLDAAVRWWRQHPEIPRQEILDRLTDLLASFGSMTRRTR